MEKEQSRLSNSDPTALTTQMVWRELESLKELVQTKFDAIEKAIEVAHEDMVRVPTEVQKAVSTLKDLHEEKFRGIEKQLKDHDRLNATTFDGIQKQFEERDTRATEQNQASIQAIAKSESAATKQIDQITALVYTRTDALADRMNDQKERLTRIEGSATGTEKARDYTTTIAGIVVGSLIAIGGIIFGLLRSAP